MIQDLYLYNWTAMAVVHHDNRQMTLFAAALMEPKDFCKKWVTHLQPGDWGYFTACVEELANATGLSSRTVEKWGADFERRPDSVLITLRKEDTLKEIQKLLQLNEANPYSQLLDTQIDDDLEIIEPWDYCLYWISDISPSKHGYRTECVRELVKATFDQYKFNTINQGWGAKFEKRPESALSLIKINHHLRLIQQKVSQVRSLEKQALYEQLVEISQIINKLLPPKVDKSN